MHNLLFFSLTMLSMSQPSFNKNLIKRFYGEWVVSHSNHPFLTNTISCTNSKIIEIFPKKNLILHESKYFGPFLYSTKTLGKFMIECNENNCILDKDDNEDFDCKLNIKWYEKKFYLESIFGIGVNEIETQIFYEKIPENMIFSIDYIKTNCIYMSNDHDFQLHLIRNTVPKIHRNGTPLSTFIFAQIFGSILLHIIHLYFKLLDI